MRYAIRYRYPGTVNGEAVGVVYAQDIDHISPGCWSYTRLESEATSWPDYDSAFRAKQKHRWPESEVVEVP